MLHPYLTKRAYSGHDALRVKAVHDVSLYGDKAVISDYTVREFKDQFRTLINLFIGYVNDHSEELIPAQKELNIRMLRTLSRNIFDPIYTHDQPALYFEDIKVNLEGIYRWLQDPKNEARRKQDLLTDLCENLEACGPGLYMHIQLAFSKIQNVGSYAFWLEEVRLQILDDFVTKIFIPGQCISEGMQIHAFAYIRSLCEQLGFVEPIGDGRVQDPFVRVIEQNFKRNLQENRCYDSDTRQYIPIPSPEELVSEFFTNFFTPTKVVETICSRINFGISDLARENGIQRLPSGFFPYDFKFYNLVNDFVKSLALEITADDVFNRAALALEPPELQFDTKKLCIYSAPAG